MITMATTKARADLPRLLDLVEQGERVEITRRGRTVAVLASPDDVRKPRAATLLADAEAQARALDALRAHPAPITPVIGADRAAELVAHIREGRETR